MRKTGCLAFPLSIHWLIFVPVFFFPSNFSLLYLTINMVHYLLFFITLVSCLYHLVFTLINVYVGGECDGTTPICAAGCYWVSWSCLKPKELVHDGSDMASLVLRNLYQYCLYMCIYILANVSKVTVYFEPKFESVTWVPIFLLLN